MEMEETNKVKIADEKLLPALTNELRAVLRVQRELAETIESKISVLHYSPKEKESSPVPDEPLPNSFIDDYQSLIIYATNTQRMLQECVNGLERIV